MWELVGFIEVPAGEEPGFDHADVHLDSGRLYVAHTGADRIDVIDCRTDTYVRALSDLPGVAGVLVDNESDLLFSSDRGAARVSIFHCSNEALMNRVTVGPHPNGLAYDADRRSLFTFCLGEVVDVDHGEVVATLSLPGRPRWAVFDKETDSVFANIADPAQIVAIGGRSLSIDRTINVPAIGPHGLVLEDARLHCATDDGSLVTLDRGSGDVLSSLALPGPPDVVMLDAQQSRLFVATGDPGVIFVADTVRLCQVDEIKTEEGAHTIAWNPVLRKLYAFLPKSMGVSVFREGSPRPTHSSEGGST